MAPAALAAAVTSKKRPNSPAKRAWNEERLDIPSILVGGGQENASTARHNIEQGIDPPRKSSEQVQGRHRANSLRNAKNSKEVLRQRSIKSTKRDNEMERHVSTREGRQFTVANVGNNGKIYLGLVIQLFNDYPKHFDCHGISQVLMVVYIVLTRLNSDLQSEPLRSRNRSLPQISLRLLQNSPVPNLKSKLQTKESAGQTHRPPGHHLDHEELSRSDLRRDAQWLCLSDRRRCREATRCQR